LRDWRKRGDDRRGDAEKHGDHGKVIIFLTAKNGTTGGANCEGLGMSPLRNF